MHTILGSGAERQTIDSHSVGFPDAVLSNFAEEFRFPNHTTIGPALAPHQQGVLCIGTISQFSPVDVSKRSDSD